MKDTDLVMVYRNNSGARTVPVSAVTAPFTAYTSIDRAVLRRQATFGNVSTGQIKATGSIATTSSISALIGSTTDYFSVGGTLYFGYSIAKSLTSGLYFYPQYLTDTNTDTGTQPSFNVASYPAKANKKTGGSQYFMNISPTYNQAGGTAANTDLRINRTETAIGSGIQRLFSAGTGGDTYVEKFGIDNTGNTSVAGRLNVSGGLISQGGVDAGNIITAGQASLVYGDVIGKRLATYGSGPYDNISSIIKHRSNSSNPHATTAAQLGLVNTCTNRVSYDGLDGSVIFTGSGAPDNANGKKIDVYLNTLTGDFYRKDTATTWTLKGNIKGPQGNNGTNGTAATVAVGTVTALAYGNAPYVDNVGTSLAAILNFGVVTGQTGAAGSPDTQAQILAKIATPTDGVKVQVQQGGTEAGTVSKFEVIDSSGNVTATIPGNGSLAIRKAGKVLFKYDTPTQELIQYRGDGVTVSFRRYSSGRTRMYGSLTL